MHRSFGWVAGGVPRGAAAGRPRGRPTRRGAAASKNLSLNGAMGAAPRPPAARLARRPIGGSAAAARPKTQLRASPKARACGRAVRHTHHRRLLFPLIPPLPGSARAHPPLPLSRWPLQHPFQARTGVRTGTLRRGEPRAPPPRALQ